MGTLTEEIFSYKLGRPVKAGETVVVEVDHVMSHDTTTPLAIEAFRKLADLTRGKAFDRQRSHLIFDHIIPAATIQAASLHRQTRNFAREQGLEILQQGICHQVMPEMGFVTPARSSSVRIVTVAAMARSARLAQVWVRPTLAWPMPPGGPGSACPRRSMCI